MKSNIRSNRFAGVTLIELLVAITILAIVVTAAIPSFQDFIRNNRVTGQSNELSSLLSFARSEATTREQGTTIRFPSGSDCASQWCIEIADRACPDSCILREAELDNVLLEVESGPTPLTLDFNNRGVLETGEVTLALKHLPCSGDRQRRQIRILISGAVRSKTTACGGE